jgi:hypothetical protein
MTAWISDVIPSHHALRGVMMKQHHGARHSVNTVHASVSFNYGKLPDIFIEFQQSDTKDKGHIGRSKIEETSR